MAIYFRSKLLKKTLVPLSIIRLQDVNSITKRMSGRFEHRYQSRVYRRACVMTQVRPSHVPGHLPRQAPDN